MSAPTLAGRGTIPKWTRLADLTPAPWNPRTVKTAAFKALCASLEADPDFLWRRPILATADGTIYAGNVRYRAAEALGWTDVPALVEDVPERLAKERALRDNNNVGEWQEQELAELLYGLRQDGAALDALAFDRGEVDRLLASVGVGGGAEAPEAEVDRAEELREQWSVELGQLWVIGKHRVLCGDCTDPAVTAALLNGERAALGLHDPPYGLRARMAWGFGDGRRDGAAAAPRGTFTPVAGDDRPFDPTAALASADVVVLWGANHYADKLPASPAWLVWDKRGDLPSNDQSDVELAWVSTGNVARLIRHRWNGMIRDSERDEPRAHPTQKPVVVWADLIERYTKPGDVVADWYAGSGTTLLAAERTGRRCFACELEPKYVAVTLERLSQMGLEPRLVTD